jgi:hypothetical protein
MSAFWPIAGLFGGAGGPLGNAVAQQQEWLREAALQDELAQKRAELKALRQQEHARQQRELDCLCLYPETRAALEQQRLRRMEEDLDVRIASDLVLVDAGGGSPEYEPKVCDSWFDSELFLKTQEIELRARCEGRDLSHEDAKREARAALMTNPAYVAKLRERHRKQRAELDSATRQLGLTQEQLKAATDPLVIPKGALSAPVDLAAMVEETRRVGSRMLGTDDTTSQYGSQALQGEATRHAQQAAKTAIALFRAHVRPTLSKTVAGHFLNDQERRAAQEWVDAAWERTKRWCPHDCGLSYFREVIFMPAVELFNDQLAHGIYRHLEPGDVEGMHTEFQLLLRTFVDRKNNKAQTIPRIPPF